MRSIQPWHVLLFILVLGFLIRSVPLQFEGFTDADAFFHARMAQIIVNTHALPSWDALSEQGRIYSYPPLLHVLIASVSIATTLPIEWSYKLIGILFGALSACTVFLLAKKLSNSNELSLMAAFFSVLSIIGVLRSNGFLRPDGWATLLIPFILWLWLERQSVLALLLTALMVFIHPLSAVVLGILLGVWLLFALVRKESFSPLMPLAILALPLLAWIWMQLAQLDWRNYFSHVALTASELAPFQLMDLIILFPVAWAFWFAGLAKWKSLPPLLLVWSIVSLGLGMVGNRFMVFALPFHAIVAAFGFMEVWKYLQQQSPERVHLSQSILGLLIVVLAAAGIFFVMSTATPFFSPATQQGVQWLQARASPSDSVISYWDKGHALAYSTGLPQVVDGYFEFSHELQARVDNMWTLFGASDCTTLREEFNKFHPRFAFLSPRELDPISVKTGLLQANCPFLRIPYASDGARIVERFQP